jgi:hypothetical protein
MSFQIAGVPFDDVIEKATADTKAILAAEEPDTHEDQKVDPFDQVENLTADQQRRQAGREWAKQARQRSAAIDEHYDAVAAAKQKELDDAIAARAAMTAEDGIAAARRIRLW